MALGIYEEEDIRALAKEIRAWKGGGSPMTVKEMKDEIQNVRESGFSDGWSDGYYSGIGEGREEGRAEGLAEGKSQAYAEVEPINAQLENTLNGTDTGGKSYYDELWDAYQQNGNIKDCNRLFCGLGWTDDTFKPKHPIKPSGNTSAYMMFSRCGISDAFRKNSIEIDFSNVTGSNSEIFANCWNLIYVPTLDFSKCSIITNLFSYDSNLVTVEKIIFSSNTRIDTCFTSCDALENLIIEGTIGQNGFNVQWSTKLSKASIISIINALSTTTSGLSVTLSKTAVETAFGSTESEEWIALINTRSNWTINLV
jgi:hypothetical protein